MLKWEGRQSCMELATWRTEVTGMKEGIESQLARLKGEQECSW